MNKHKKQNRNDKCNCGSGKKYKVCCQKKLQAIQDQEFDKLNNGHPISSSNVQECYDCFIELYKYYKIIDVSNYLTNDSYEKYQKRHYFDKVIMIAERNDTNDGVFKTRAPDNINIMILHSGAYKCFKFDDLHIAFDQVVDMIEKRKIERQKN